MKILVTGATGFIGKWVMKELGASEHTAVAFSGDVRDKSTYPKGPFDVIIHLAAKVDKKFWRSNDLYKVNVGGTKNIVEHYSNSKVVYISSADVEKKTLSEYAKTKKKAENIVLSNSKNLVIRPPSIFGPGDKHDKLITRLFKKYMENGVCEIYNDDENEYMYVGDVVGHIVAGMDYQGISRPRGFKIKNLDLDTMIRAICLGEKIPDLTPEEQKFFSNLEHCLLTFAQNEYMHMKIFFDLDGTLIDISERYYRVYTDILNKAGFSTIGKKEYWNAKRNKVPEDQILAMTNANDFYKEYNQKRLSLIENDYYLSNDSLHEGVIQVIENLSKKYQLVLVTLRKSNSQLEKQLINMKLIDYFTDILRSDDNLKPRWMIKYHLIKEYIGNEHDSSSILISDTENDIKAGNELRFKTIAVLNGIRTKELLIISKPTFICKSVKDLLNIEYIM